MAELSGATITVDELATVIADGATVIDVREVDEYVEARVPGVRLIPLGTLPDSVDALPLDETLFVICRSGARSQRAVEFLEHRGIDAVNVEGGTMAWLARGFAHESGDDAQSGAQR